LENCLFFRARFAARGAIILFHEMQRDCQSELMPEHALSQRVTNVSAIRSAFVSSPN
jgi:hypothetical protein